MAHGTPDWGHVKQETTFALVDDLAELAARLGSIDVYDRRGNVLWMDDFNEGMEAWEGVTSGTGSSVAISTDFPKFPPNSIKLTAGSNILQLAYISYRMGFPVLKRISLEVSVAFFTRFDRFQIILIYWDGSGYKRGLINISDTDRKIYYETSGAADVELADLDDLMHIRGCYHVFKLVVDFETDKYIRLLFNDVSYDLSAYSLNSSSSTIIPHLAPRLYFYGRSGENDYCQVDGVILKQGEPLE